MGKKLELDRDIVRITGYVWCDNCLEVHGDEARYEDIVDECNESSWSYIYEGENYPYYVDDSPIHGSGVFVSRFSSRDFRGIKKGTAFEIKGKYQTEPEAKGKGIDVKHPKRLVYVPTDCWRFLNHSTTPNCHLEYQTDPRGWSRVWVVASRDLKPDEEMLIDYGFDPST